jgi:hypothetical protein
MGLFEGGSEFRLLRVDTVPYFLLYHKDNFAGNSVRRSNPLHVRGK